MPLPAMRKIFMLVPALFKKVAFLVLASFALSSTVFGHTVDSYTSSCTGVSYIITPVVSSVNNTSNYNWQYKNAAGVWVCLVNGTNTIGSVTLTASGVSASATTTPPILNLTNLSASLDGVVFRLIIVDVNPPCNPGTATVYNGGCTSTNFTVANSSCAVNRGPCQSCLLGYPDNSNLPRSAAVFSENEVLAAMEPSSTTCGILDAGFIKVWYTDEHALLLGIKTVTVKRTNGTSYSTNYPISAYGGTPTCGNSLLFGTTINSGAQAGNDVADGGGRPIRPSLFITDLTVNGLSSRAGDWQQGGTGYNPTTVCGAWKGGVKLVDSTTNPVAITVTPDADPSANGWNLGAGDPPPAGTSGLAYGALAKWDIQTLGLLPGHLYRIQVMIHDGDQNKTGGDAGSMCTTIFVPVVYNPDINVTYVNVPVPGDVHTNDKVPTGTTYGTPILLSKPTGSSPSITMNSNGTYSFVSNLVGVYTYNVPVCIPGSTTCTNTLLTITVLGPTIFTNPPVANTDIATTKINTPVTLRTLINDRPGQGTTSLVPSSVVVTVAPKHGTTSVNTTTGDNTYTPATGYVGQDTLTYRVCDNSSPSALCATAIQIITIRKADAANSTLAADDYAYTLVNTPVTGNVKTNDTDPEGNTQTVATQTTTAAGKGTLVLAADGSYTFTPVTGYTGPVNFPYTTCDNGTPQACASATLYIIVRPPAGFTNPDINTTFVNVHVPGDVHTNDHMPVGTTYGTSPTLLSGPAGSHPVIVMNPNGTYDFVSDVIGVYTYDVPVCEPGAASPCAPTKLVITVLDANSNSNAPVANVDIATTNLNTPVILKTLVNDAAGNPAIALVTGTVTVTVPPLHGTAVPNAATGDMTYTPAVGFFGNDTLTYSVSDNQAPAKSAIAKQIITIKPTGAPNTTSAADDYKILPMNTPGTGNVKTNDTDPEGDAQTVATQNTTIAGKGNLVLAADGSYTFTPFAGFSGPIDYPYSTCDNGTPQACASATLHILVLPAALLPDLTPSIFNDANTVFLNGSRDNAIRIFNIGSGPTSAPIIFTIPKMQPLFDIAVDGARTTVDVFGGLDVTNSNWTIVEEASRFVFTSKPGVVIPAGGSNTIGLTLTGRGIVNTTGNLSITIVFGTGGGETPFNNNRDNRTYSIN